MRKKQMRVHEADNASKNSGDPPKRFERRETFDSSVALGAT